MQSIANPQKSTIILIDDSPLNIQILKQTLSEQYNVKPFSSVVEAIQYLECKPTVDLILLDIDMPNVNGYEAFSIIKDKLYMHDVPIIFVTAREDVESEIAAFDIGIVDYIKKPITPLIAKRRIAYHMGNSLREKCTARESKQIKKITEVTIKTLVLLADKFNGQSAEHVDRIMQYVLVLSNALVANGDYKEQLTPDFIEDLRLSSPFHDCGKAYICETILTKQDKLNSDEYEQIKKHTLFGAELIKKARQFMGEASFYDLAEQMVLNYREKWDGTGYPNGIKGEAIPLCARIMSLAHVYDALVSRLAYKPAYTHEKAVGIINDERGKAFDPQVCQAFSQASYAFSQISKSNSVI